MSLIPVGYQALIEKYDLTVLPHYRQSYITLKGRGSTVIHHNYEKHIYPKTYALKSDEALDHLEFALKHEGFHLGIIASLFKIVHSDDIKAYFLSQPTSKYARKIWFLYEYLTQRKIDIDDSKNLKYVELIDSSKYYTSDGTKSVRHKVINNLLGNREFCPFIRKTEALDSFCKKQLEYKAREITAQYDPRLLARASHYLYVKETISSYEIERERPKQGRLSRFVEMLKLAHKMEHISKQDLIKLQNLIVDERFKDVDYRANQNYIGENINPYFQNIHYISPKPEDVESLMDGLLHVLEHGINNEFHPVILAAIVAFGFVFIHPFEDGNGRVHRFLIHYILSRLGFTPKDIIFPVSAVMLQNIHDYDKVLESYSKPLLSIIDDYNLNNEGVLKVNQETKQFYQYIDYSKFAEYLFECIEITLREHFEKEILYLANYDAAKAHIQEVIDLPDRLIDLFIRFCMQNNGKLSKSKQEKYFAKLTDNEIVLMESVVQEHMLNISEST